nr:helix-turn-helix transcriptional regulator [Ruminococcus sp. NK3A76]
MNISEAVSERIISLCIERGITVNKLSTISGVTQSTVNDIVNHHARNIGIVTIKKLCDGLDITITEFFNTEVFKSLTQEMY